MTTIILTPAEVRRLLAMRECIDAVADALRALSAGEALNPLRWGVRLPAERGLIGLMPGFLPGTGALGLKAVTYFPGNHGTPYDSHQGVVLLFEAEYGRLLAMMDATSITTIRTAAVSALATRHLAREDASTLGLLGSGVQARAHLESMLLVRPFRALRIWSRNAEHAAAFAEEVSRRQAIDVDVAPSAEAAVSESDVVCTTTSAREPVLMGEWLRPGVHVNAIGASQRTARELDSAAVARSRLFVDRRESALKEPGDILVPLEEGAITSAHIVAELGELVLGTAAGRRSPDEITLFKSLGLAIEDLASAHHVYTRAQREGVGLWIAFGGVREVEAEPAARPVA